LRAALTAAHLLGLAIGRSLRDLRGLSDPLLQAKALLKEAELRASVAWDIVEILGARLDKIPERHRPYHTPAHRFRILEIRSFVGWSREAAARLFRVCPNTISNWEKHADPDSKTVGSTVKPTPPVTRLADVGRRLIQSMLRLGFGGEDLVAQALARAGWKVSARSVRRIGRERARPHPVPPPRGIDIRPRTPVIARFSNHVWMMDVSVVQALLGGEFYLAAVFDAFSRAPLAVSTHEHKPGAAAMARLLKIAARAFGPPKYVVTDQGREFTGRVFAKAVGRLRIVQRLGSTMNSFATARIERFWRTLKQAASLRLHPPLTLGDLERRLGIALTHYVWLRPNQGLLGATPGEAFLGLPPAVCTASSPPCARPGEGPRVAPFVIAFLDPDTRDFPFLKAA
jgi:transposase InsO family protein